MPIAIIQKKSLVKLCLLLSLCAFALTTAYTFLPQTAAARDDKTQAKKKSRFAKPKAEEKAEGKKRGAKSDYLAQGRPRERYDQPREAADFFNKKRLPAGEKIFPIEKYFAAQEQLREIPVFSTARNQYLTGQQAETTWLRAEAKAAPEQTTWTPLGPGNIGGRTRALLVNPQDANIMFAAGVTGGVWKTTNGGTTWAPVSDKLANIAVSALAFAPGNPSIIYAGTGEGVAAFSEDTQGDFRGAGIFRSTDGGATWTRLASTAGEEFHFVNDIVVSTGNNERIYAATRAGVMRSRDGGATWTRVLEPLNSDGDAASGGCLDLVMRTDRTDADVVFASCGTFEQATIYRNTDAGGAGTWTAVFTEAGMGRTALALAPSNQNIVYALASEVDENSNFFLALHAVFRSTTGGEPGSWTARVRNTNANKLNTALLSFTLLGAFATNCGLSTGDDFTAQAWYDLVIAVDPLDPERVWVGGIDLFRSDDGGANWGLAAHTYLSDKLPQYTHPDQHALVFHPQYNGTSNQTLFVGNDGGLFRTDNARAATATGATAPCRAANSAVTWKSINNNYAVTQFYAGAVLPNGASYFGGTQDNGTVLGTDAGGANAWKEINGGDGGYAVADPRDPNTLYSAATAISIEKSTDGGASFSFATSGIGDDGLFITPYVIDPSDPARLWTGGGFLWRTNNGAARWTRASALTAGRGLVSALAVAPTDANYLLVGMSDGYILRTDAGLTANAATNFPGRQPRTNAWVSWVAFDPNNRNIAYATYSTFDGPHVFKSTDGGVNWTPSDGAGTGALPDIPVHCLVIDPNNMQRLYLGTDLGVFVSNDGGGSWAVENTGFPNVITEALVVHVANGATQLYAFTHGRGAWRTTLSTTGCAYALSPATVNAGAGASSGTVNVTAQSGGCGWTATSNAPWIKVTGGGSGNGAVNYTLDPNTSLTPRSGTVTIAGRSFAVVQAGVPDEIAPTIAIIEPNPSGPVNDTTGAVNLRGTAADNNAVVAVTWSNDRGGSGAATGTTSWTIIALSLAAGLNNITVTARDAAGNLGRATISITSRPATLMLTAAGTGTRGAEGDGGPATAANLGLPSALAFDAAGNLYIADTYNDRIRKVDTSGRITTVAGSGQNGYGGDGGPATGPDVRLNCPTGVAVDAQGNIYIADRDNHRIRRVNAADSRITTFAGTGTRGFSGDGGAASAAQLQTPTTVALDTAGNLFIADAVNHRIRRVTANNGFISTVAGNGREGFGGDNGPAIAAALSTPIGVGLDAAGNIYIADTNNNRVRRVNAADGVISTVAGTGVRGNAGDGGLATAAQLGFPEGVWVDPAGNVYISDTFNDRVRRITLSDGRINTIAGNGLTGFSGDGVAATGTRLYCPTSVLLDAAGRLYIADRENHRVRLVIPVPAGDVTPPTIALTAPTTGSTFSTAVSPLNLSGTASDNTALGPIRWVNERGGSGLAAGTNNWTATGIPLLQGLNTITVTAYDLSGNAASLTLAVTFTPAQVLFTLAGDGAAGAVGDGGPAAAAQLFTPRGVAVDAAGNVYVSDTLNQRVRKIAPNGVITAFAGTGQLGSSGDGGLAINATLNEPEGLVVDSAGNVYIADSNNNRIRRVTPEGRISTYAGTGKNTGLEGEIGDGGAATAAELGAPTGVALDSGGNLYIAEFFGQRIRKVTATTGVISTVAGNGQVGFAGDNGPATQAKILFPWGVTVDRSGAIYFTQLGDHRVRKVDAGGVITTFAGTGRAGYNGDNQAANLAQLSNPLHLAVDGAGDLYIADSGNHRIRKVTVSTGRISTVAGTGVAGSAGDGGAPATAQLASPGALAFDAAGNLFIADSGNNRVRRLLAGAAINALASVSAASFTGAALASESIAAAFGANLAAAVQTARTLPLPTTLGGVTLRVRDSAGVERFAPLFFVSPGQINYLIPAGTAVGAATVSLTGSNGALSTGVLQIATIAPGLFAANANGQGVLSAVALRVAADGAQTFEPVARFDAATNSFVAVPLDLGPEGEQVFLIAFGTGLRFRSALTAVTATVGGAPAEVLFAGTQGGFSGLDQVNLRLPRSLAGRGAVDVILTVDGKAANTVRVNIR